MTRQLSGWFYRNSTGAVTLAALVAFVLFAALVLPRQSTGVVAGVIPDLRLFYTPADLYQLAEGYGVQGRLAFVKSHFTFDLAWPVVYTAFLTTAISWLLARSLPASSPRRLANLLPFTGMLLDYLENSAVSLVVYRYPETTPVIDSAAGFITLVKWAFAAASMVALVLSLVVFVFRSLNHKGTKDTKM